MDATLDEEVAHAETKLKAGDLGGAYEMLRSVLRRSRLNARAHFAMSRIAYLKGAISDALNLADIAIQLDTSNADFLAQSASCRLAAGDITGATVCARRALAEHPQSPEMLSDLAVLFHGIADYRRSGDALAAAAILDPENAVIRTNLAAVKALCGDVDAARRAAESAIDINPADARAYAVLSEVRRASLADNQISTLEAQIAQATDPLSVNVFAHALARESDDIENPAAAFEWLRKGKSALLRGRENAILDAIAHLFDRLEQLATQTRPTVKDTSSAASIFIVGMPRSGTTVVERILTNGTGVMSIGESGKLPELVKRYSRSGSRTFVDPDALAAAWRSLDFAAIGREYAAHGHTLAEGADRFIDKMPLNLLLADTIIQAMPQAKIVCVVRDAMDTVVGNYRQNFEQISGTYDYALSLEATAEFTARALEMTQRLARQSPSAFMIVRYEDLIDAPLKWGRALTDFCGIPWHDTLVQIEHNAAPAGSASAIQVLKPLHAGFVQRWRRYEADLDPAKMVLDEAGIDWR